MNNTTLFDGNNTIQQILGLIYRYRKTFNFHDKKCTVFKYFLKQTKPVECKTKQFAALEKSDLNDENLQFLDQFIFINANLSNNNNKLAIKRNNNKLTIEPTTNFFILEYLTSN